MSSAISAPVHSRGLYLPPVAGYLIAFYLDRCATGFGSGGAWRDSWPGVAGPVQTVGFDAGSIRLRVVIERCDRRQARATRPPNGLSAGGEFRLR